MKSRIVRNVMFPLQEVLKGKPTHAYLRELENTQWLSRSELLELQFRRLKDRLQFAYQNVSYYQNLFKQNEVDPAKLQSCKDISQIPFLTKNIIREHFGALQSKTPISGVKKMSTGGSTGHPVTVLVDSERAAFTDAVRLRAHGWFGVPVGSPEVVLWGSPIELGRQDYLRTVRDWMMNSHLLSAFDMGEDKLAQYAEFIRRYRPEKLYGYSSALFLLANYVRHSGRQLFDSIKVVFATAEPLLEFQRKLIEDTFQCAVAVEYGARDAGLMANECPSGGLHIPAEGMLVEVDSVDGSGFGEIIVTNLYSRAMPIIRYRTGDMGELDPGPCSCGRGLPLLKKVEGRQTDFLVNASGKIIHALAMIYVLREMPKVKEFQVIQETLNEVSIRLVVESTLFRSERAQLVSKAQMALDKDIRFTIEEVDAIPRLPSGKFRYVMSKIAEERLSKIATIG